MAGDVTDCDDQAAKLRLAAAVFTCTQEGIVTTDTEGRVVAVNPAFSAMTGYRKLSRLAFRMLRTRTTVAMLRHWTRRAVDSFHS